MAGFTPGMGIYRRPGMLHPRSGDLYRDFEFVPEWVDFFSGNREKKFIPIMGVLNFRLGGFIHGREDLY